MVNYAGNGGNLRQNKRERRIVDLDGVYTKRKQKKDRNLPENVEVLSAARQYDAQVMLSALPHTISVVRGTDNELRLRRIRDGPPRSDERYDGQPRQIDRPWYSANATVNRAPAVEMGVGLPDGCAACSAPARAWPARDGRSRWGALA